MKSSLFVLTLILLLGYGGYCHDSTIDMVQDKYFSMITFKSDNKHNHLPIYLIEHLFKIHHFITP